jgi:HSP20 family molecular chaperone IbpA
MSGNFGNNGGIDFSYIKNYIDDILEKSLGQNDDNQSFDFDSEGLQNYIQDMIAISLQQGFNNSKNTFDSSNLSRNSNYPTPEIFETHDYRILRVDIPKGVSRRHIESFVRGNQLVIKWGPGIEDQIIPITFDMDPDNVKGVVKDNILELRFSKDVKIEAKSIEIEHLG